MYTCTINIWGLGDTRIYLWVTLESLYPVMQPQAQKFGDINFLWKDFKNFSCLWHSFNTCSQPCIISHRLVIHYNPWLQPWSWIQMASSAKVKAAKLKVERVQDGQAFICPGASVSSGTVHAKIISAFSQSPYLLNAQWLCRRVLKYQNLASIVFQETK